MRGNEDGDEGGHDGHASSRRRSWDAATPVVLEVPTFRTGDVVVHDGAAVVGFGLAGKREVVVSGGDGAIASGEEDGDEGLFEVVVGAFAFDERAAKPFDFLPVEFTTI